MNPIPRFVFRRNVADSGVQSESGILFQKAHSMRSNPEDGLFRGECFPGPEILGGIAEKERVVHRGVGEIENPDCTSAIGERLAVDAAGTCGFHSGFRCENILVDGDDVIVGEQLEGWLIHAGDVAAEEKRRGEKTPERELHFLFFRSQIGRLVGRIRTVRDADGSDLQHVGIVPVSRRHVFPPAGIVLKTDAADAFPGIFDVSGDPPHLGEFGELRCKLIGCHVRSCGEHG